MQRNDDAQHRIRPVQRWLYGRMNESSVHREMQHLLNENGGAHAGCTANTKQAQPKPFARIVQLAEGCAKCFSCPNSMRFAIREIACNA